MIKKIPNILFSTTRSWNPGDDFILFGIINLFRGILTSPFNPVIFNRNPALHQLKMKFNRTSQLQKNGTMQPINFYRTLKPHWQHYDNSWSKELDISLFDLIVFAGTPEWLCPMNEDLVKAALARNIPTIYLGIGSFEGTAKAKLFQLPPQDQELLKKAKLIVARDDTCQKILDPLQVERLPCPALFASTHHKKRRKIKRIALSTQGVRNGQYINPFVFDYTVSLFKLIREHYECGLICHYIDELHELKSVLGNQIPFYYSYDPKDYIDIYDQFDFCITTRVHGAGLSASLGILSFLVTHSTRSETVRDFLSEIINPDQLSPEKLVEKIKYMNIKNSSKSLLEHKKVVYSKYKKLLSPILKDNLYV